MTRFLAEGFSLGLSTGPYCLSACAPLLVPFMLADGRGTWRGNALLLAEFIAGRLAAYLLFGLAAGAIGSAFAGRLPPRLLYAAMAFSGLLMLAIMALKTAPQLSLCAWALRSRGLKRLPFALGFVVGVNVCPPFVAGLAQALRLASPSAGASYFLAFFIGTTLYMLPLFAIVPLAFMKRLQDIGAIACGLTGLWFTGLGLHGLFKG
ncbi:MAG: sulfite exporter TauE/SafE family protein [Elusimicrobia bacterium]|nr:sulfite exporter TauE/SafE family protein [Elusimicrobiota bacterium]